MSSMEVLKTVQMGREALPLTCLAVFLPLLVILEFFPLGYRLYPVSVHPQLESFTWLTPVGWLYGASSWGK